MKLIQKTTLLFVICLTITKYAASQHTWYVGLHFNPGTYQLYNKNDWNADPILIYPVTGKLNSWTVGSTVTYIWSKHFGASSGLLYQHCKQEFLAKKDPSSPDPLTFYSITDEFNYLKLPINFEYSTNNEAKHQFVASLGIQTSFLMDYREHFLQKSTGFYSEYERYNRKGTAISSNNSDSKYTKFLFSRLLVGLTSSISYCLRFSDGWKLKIGVISDYDLTNAENRKAKNADNDQLFWSSGIKRYGYGGSIDTRPKTHNRSWGIYISTSIPISVR